VAIIGRTGSGKSTLAQLLLRQFDPQIGQILVDGQDLRTYEPGSLRGQIGYVPQDVFLFSDTIAQNISFGSKEGNLVRVKDAARQASVDKEIDQFAQQYDTMVGERGHRLSGGEKQRLAIARLLLKSPQVVILDEATAHLDSENEALVHQALSAALKGRTSLVIAHRLSTVRDADQILVLEKGVIVERGTHDELVAKNGLYAELYNRQDLSGSTD
jgi:ATP-binding cassette subfamily B protein